jgi:DNA (cytosine-5)-methyltransferase 1
MNYYNEWDKDAAAWLRELIKAGLIPNGDVDERSITEVKAHELTEYIQCHFFAGIGGWPLAFQIAGIPDDENGDTGSCPCQPFSGTGKQMGFSDPRHLWPAFRRVIGKRQSAKVYGEQVASKLGREWLARVFSDLAFMGYAGAGADLCSAGIGSPTIRQRLYWVGDAVCAGPLSSAQSRADRSEAGGRTRNGVSAGSGAVDRLAQSHGRKCDGITDGERRIGDGQETGRQQGNSQPEPCCKPSGVALPHSERQLGQHPLLRPESGGPGAGEIPETSGSGLAHRLGYADRARREGRLIRWDGGNECAAGETGLGMWSDCELIFCRDQKWRRIGPGSFPLANGIPSRVGPLLTELRKLGRSSVSLARANRNIRLKGYGNAINPWVAAAFIKSDLHGLIRPLATISAEPLNFD